MHLHTYNIQLFDITELYCLVWYLMLAWNSEIQMRLGHFGLAIMGKKDSRSGKAIQIKGQLMGRLHHVNLCVQMRVIDHKIKGIT